MKKVSSPSHARQETGLRTSSANQGFIFPHTVHHRPAPSSRPLAGFAWPGPDPTAPDFPSSFRASPPHEAISTLSSRGYPPLKARSDSRFPTSHRPSIVKPACPNPTEEGHCIEAGDESSPSVQSNDSNPQTEPPSWISQRQSILPDPADRSTSRHKNAIHHQLPSFFQCPTHKDPVQRENSESVASTRMHKPEFNSISTPSTQRERKELLCFASSYRDRDFPWSHARCMTEAIHTLVRRADQRLTRDAHSSASSMSYIERGTATRLPPNSSWALPERGPNKQSQVKQKEKRIQAKRGLNTR